MGREIMSGMTEPKPGYDWDSLTFAYTPTDTMFVATTLKDEPWKDNGKLVPFGNISISPAAGVLNYGQGVFEGIKAQRTAAGDIVIFRPDANAARFANGAKRLGMTPVPEAIFVAAVHDVVRANAHWVPPSGKGALYIRPLLIGSGPIMSVTPAPEFTFLIYCTPVGSYFKGGAMAGISLKVSDEFHRVCSGGVGGVKSIGNYAPGMLPAQLAKEEGFAEILYLDAQNHRYVEEVGAANFFCVKDGILYTPGLSGTILPGVTRMSVIKIAQEFGHEVRECKLDISLALEADEAFCSGTAAVISPIGSMTHGAKVAHFASAPGPIAKKLYEALVGIQTGRAADKHGWVSKVSFPSAKL